MSTREDREWDAWIDDHTPCLRCRQNLTNCRCDDAELPTECDACFQLVCTCPQLPLDEETPA